MKFQKKILMLYAVFAAAIILIIGGIYLTISVKNHKDNIEGSIKTVSDVKVQQLNNMFDNMESVTTYLLSEQEVLEAIKVLSDTDIGLSDFEENNTEFYFQNEVATIRSRLKTYYMLKEYSKIIIFNENDNVVSNDPRQNIKTGFNYSEYPWIDMVENTSGRSVIIAAHKDSWDVMGSEVVSLLREIQMENKSYVEVQVTTQGIGEILGNVGDSIDYIVQTDDGNLIYSTDTDMDYEEAKEMHSYEMKSSEHGFSLLTVIHTDIVGYALREVLPFTLAMLGILVALSFIYIYYASVYLSRPIRQLQHFMENTELENIGDEIEEKISNDEIESLYLSYKDVLNRLNESVVKEKNLSILQMQAQFDLLQAQVNPHFIYNVLNVISERGLALDDEVICEVCSDLSEILRYSTNTKQKYATIREEIDYLRLYLALLKFRYQDKLQYEIGINKDVYEETFPKIVMQQLVENSVLHGYKNSSDIIKIEICGCKEETSWCILIRDYGDGMSPEKMQELYKQMQEIKDKLTLNRSNVEMEIGGMGLVNVYARLYLLFGERLEFELINHEDKGMTVSIVIRDKYAEVYLEENGETNV